MKLKISLVSTYYAVAISVVTAQECPALPGMQEMIDRAFPPWNIDENENRIEGGGKWTPLT